MLFVITGNGKGKTTGALGMTVRALGQNLRCAVLQFIKTNPHACGEYATFNRLGVAWENYGCGFTWQQESMGPTKEECEKGWASFMEKVSGGNYDFILLDEFTYVLEYKLLDENMVLDVLRRYKDRVHVVITGRNASDRLVELADTVSVLEEVKHHYMKGISAVKGIEF